MSEYSSPINFIDLKAQQSLIRREHAAIASVLDLWVVYNGP